MYAKTALIIISVVAAVGLTLTASTRHVFASDTGGIKGKAFASAVDASGGFQSKGQGALSSGVTNTEQQALGAVAKIKAHASSGLTNTEEEVRMLFPLVDQIGNLIDNLQNTHLSHH